MKHLTGWCFAIAVAVATAGHSSVALPNPHSYGVGMRRFGETEAYQTEDMTSTSTTAPNQEGPEQRLSTLMKAIHKQTQLQENLLHQLIKEVQDYLRSVAQGWDVSQVDATDMVHRMLEMMGNRMAATAESIAEFMNNSGNMDGGAVREATRRFMKEASLQDVVIDAVWAALRGVQTGAWMAGIGAIENGEPLPVHYQAAEEFFTRVVQNMRTAGVGEEDVRKFVPQVEQGGMGQRSRKMGKRGYYGYGGYGYGRAYGYYGYGYPSYYSYGYSSYPSYYSYGYAYPSYYSYGYPSYYGYSYPYYASYYYRRLRRLPFEMMPPPPMGMPMAGPRALYEEPPMPMEPMMEGQGFVPPMEYAEEVPPAEFYPEPMMVPTPEPYYEDTTTAYTGARRSLAPINELSRIPPAGAPWLPF